MDTVDTTDASAPGDGLARLLSRLRQLLGTEHVITDADQRAGYEADWTGRFRGTAAAILRPADTGEVAAVMRECAGERVAIITQGGNTSLVGGSVPRPDDAHRRPQLVVSTRRLKRMDPIDTTAMQVTVGAGVTLTEWRDHARAVGVDIPVDFAARDSATIGGAIATNAGGSRVVRFATMRRQVTGIEAVLPTGEVIGSLTGLVKQTAGVDLAGVLAGSEGTLAVITAARLAVVPWYRRVATAMVAVDGFDSALGLLEAFASASDDLDSIEFIAPEALDVVAAHLGRSAPIHTTDAGLYLMVELAGHHDPTDTLVSVLGALDGVLATAVATDSASREQLLSYRDRITESINAIATPLKLDVAVAPDGLDGLIDLARAAARHHGGALYAFGHLAEGNVHLNLLGLGDATERVTDEILTAVASAGGTISAEHGIGIAKARWLPLIRNTAEIDVLCGIRQAFDPDGVMNPGVLDPQH